MPEPIGVALIGYGFAGRIFHAPFIEATPGLSLRVVASSQTSLVKSHFPRVRVVADPHEAMTADDVGLVVIATPNDSHAPLAHDALHAGRHVVVDKPFTLTLAEAQAVVAAADAAGQLLSVFQNRRWDSDFLGIREVITSGLIGDVVECRLEIGRWRPEVRDRWRERPGPGAGLWYDLGPHLIDQALLLFGLPDTVQASLRIQRPGGQTVDWFHALLEYRTRQVVVTSSMLDAAPAPRWIVRGTTGTAIKHAVDPQEAHLLAGARPGTAAWGHDVDPVHIWRDGAIVDACPVPAGNYGRFYAAMRDAVHGAGNVPVAPAEALGVMAVLGAGLRSSSARRSVHP